MALVPAEESRSNSSSSNLKRSSSADQQLNPAALENEVEGARNEAAALSNLIKKRNTFYLEREQQLSEAISTVAAKIRVLESTTPTSVEDIKKLGDEKSLKYAALATSAADFAIRLRKVREDEAMASIACGRLWEYLKKVESAVVVPDQLVRANYRNVASFRNSIVERARDFAIELTVDEEKESVFMHNNTSNNANNNNTSRSSSSSANAAEKKKKKQQQQQQAAAEKENQQGGDENNNNNNHEEEDEEEEDPEETKKKQQEEVAAALNSLTGDQLRRSSQSFHDAVHSTMNILAQESVYAKEYISSLEQELRKIRADTIEQQAALDEARSVLETTDSVYRTAESERDAKKHSVQTSQEQLRKERLALDSAVAAASEPTRTSSELTAELARLTRRADVLTREIAEADSICSATQQRCDIAMDSLIHVKEAAQRGMEAKSAALRKKADMERAVRDQQEQLQKYEGEIRSIQQKAEASVAEAQHVRDALSAAAEEKQGLVEEEKRVHRQISKADHEAGILAEQEDDLTKRISNERHRTDVLIQAQRTNNLERAKIDQEVHVKGESVAALKQQLAYVKTLLPQNHPLRSHSDFN